MPSKYGLTRQQEDRLYKDYKNLAKIMQQYPDGAILIDLYGELFVLTPAGRVLSPKDYQRGASKKTAITPVVIKPAAPIKKPEEKKAPKPAPLWEYDYSTPSYESSYKPPVSSSSSSSSWNKTFCQKEPECCKPRDVRIVAWDADHTIWDMPVTAAGVTGPLKKIDDDTVVELHQGQKIKTTELKAKDELEQLELELTAGLSDEEREKLLHIAPQPVEKEDYRTVIKLHPTFRRTLDELEKRKIPSIIISLNSPGSVKRILKEFGLEGRFQEIRDSYENKGKVYNEITRKSGICPCSGIFVDDNLSNVKDVADKQGMALQIGKTGDIQAPIDVLKFIKD